MFWLNVNSIRKFEIKKKKNLVQIGTFIKITFVQFCFKHKLYMQYYMVM